MCGIVGIFGSSHLNSQRAQDSLQKVIHRGSSRFELQYFDKAVLGANRLPIQGRATGFQPISNENGAIRACQNGEIFNYVPLREELEDLGHVFRTDCDTELWVHLYEEYGPEAVKKIDSEMFAAIVYDSTSDSYYICRDSLGVKPLYYAYHADGTLHVASELKQLAHFEDIFEIFDFPAGQYCYNGLFVAYSDITQLLEEPRISDEYHALTMLTAAIVDAVKKRVATDLPIGVFLSGGVDSSLVMEIATRFHADVTAIILGKPGSSDYEYAVRVCQDRKYKYYLVSPEDEYRNTLDEMIYQCETYEPLIIRHAFANDFCSKAAEQLGLKIVLLGEGADELFAGYNEFSTLSTSAIDQGVHKLVSDLGNGHLKRCDRLAMKYTVETRCPFLDARVVEVALRISSDLKVKKENHTITGKYILRKVAEQFLPSYITKRYKMPFANGAGMNVGNNYKKSDGDIAEYLSKKGDFLGLLDLDTRNVFGISNSYEAYHLLKFKEAKYDKLHAAHQRIIVKDVLATLESPKKQKLLIAEFDYIPLYFPVYYAQEEGFFENHDIEIEFLSTKGDYETYFTLTNNTAHIGLADPLFSMINHTHSIYGKLVGELVDKNPLVLVTINPQVTISSLNDLLQYSIGSYREFSSSHTFACYLTTESVAAFEKNDIVQALTDRTIDIALVLREDALELQRIGGRILRRFDQEFARFCFTGFTTTNILPEHLESSVKAFTIAVQESIRAIKKEPLQAFSVFSKLFPHLHAKEEIFDTYRLFRKENILPDEYDTLNAYTVRKKVYPDMMQSFKGSFFKKDAVDHLIDVFKQTKYRKDYPYLEEKLGNLVKKNRQEKVPLSFFMFRGASNKKQITHNDISTLEYVRELFTEIEKNYPFGYVLTIILADEHAVNNGYDHNDITEYLTDLMPEIQKRNFQYTLLSTLYKQTNFLREQEMNNFLNLQESQRWQGVSIRDSLEATAKKHYCESDYVVGAQQYFALRTLEKPMLETLFANSIFMTYNTSNYQMLFPNLPTVYLFTQKKGCSDLPRFVK